MQVKKMEGCCWLQKDKQKNNIRRISKIFWTNLRDTVLDDIGFRLRVSSTTNAWGLYWKNKHAIRIKECTCNIPTSNGDIFRDLQGKVCLIWVDDIVVFSTNLQKHISNLKLVFQRLRETNVKIRLDKSEYLRKEVGF